MRQVWLNRDDFAMFHQDISPLDYEFLRTHIDTFKRMWKDQTRQFWNLFLNTFEFFVWKHGCVKDFPMKSAEVRKYVDDIIQYIRDEFVNGKVSGAKNLIYDCVVVTQNRHYIAILDRATYAQNPFFMKETREVFRKLFGAPNDKKTYMKVLCGLPVYVKFAGSTVVALRRWMDAPDIDPENEIAKKNYFDNIFKRHRSFITDDFRRLEDLSDDDIPGIMRAKLAKSDAATLAEGSKAEKPTKKKKKKKSSKSSGKDPCNSSSTTEAAANGETKASADPAKVPQPHPAPKNIKTDTNGDGGSGKTVKDQLAEHSDPDGTKTTVETGDEDNSRSGSDTLEKERQKEASVSRGKSKLTKTKSKTKAEPKEQIEESAMASGDSTDALTMNESSKVDPEAKGTCAMKPKVIKQSISEESAGPMEGGKGEEPVAKEERDVAKCVTVGSDGTAARKKLHTCSLCGREEVTAKTFKRCQKCRGKLNPKYYCSRDCQVKDWKTHKLDHKDEP